MRAQSEMRHGVHHCTALYALSSLLSSLVSPALSCCERGGTEAGAEVRRRSNQPRRHAGVAMRAARDSTPTLAPSPSVCPFASVCVWCVVAVCCRRRVVGRSVCVRRCRRRRGVRRSACALVQRLVRVCCLCCACLSRCRLAELLSPHWCWSVVRSAFGGHAARTR